MTIGSALKSARKETGMTQYELARVLSRHPGCPSSVESISRFERGDTCPTDVALRTLLAVLRVPEAYHDGVYRLAREWRLAAAGAP